MANLTAAQRQLERAWFRSLGSLVLFIILLIMVSWLSGSQSIRAELVRMALMLLVEATVFASIWRIHRGQLTGFDFGHGKIEQLANFSLSLCFALGALGILVGAVTSIGKSIVPLPPFGMAIAAVYQAASTFANLMVYLGYRQSLQLGINPIAAAQSRLYRTRLICNLVLLAVLTAAALTYDSLVAHWLDVIGAMFVASIMLRTAMQMIGFGLPELLDQGANESERALIERVLNDHLSDKMALSNLRTRRTSGHIFVQVDICLPGSSTLAQANEWRSALEENLRSALGKCDLLVNIESYADATANSNTNGQMDLQATE